jgi:hypothetical protein
VIAADAWTPIIRRMRPPMMRPKLHLRRIPILLIAACVGPSGCSRQDSPQIAREALPEATPAAVSPTPDPDMTERQQLVTRIGKLSDKECDDIVLEFQLIPRDEIMEPLSKPRNELVRYVKRTALAADLHALDAALKARKK